MQTSFGYVQCSPDPHQGASAMIVPPLSPSRKDLVL
jgi:hypothetical protein